MSDYTFKEKNKKQNMYINTRFCSDVRPVYYVLISSAPMIWNTINVSPVFPSVINPLFYVHVTSSLFITNR